MEELEAGKHGKGDPMSSYGLINPNDTTKPEPETDGG